MTTAPTLALTVICHPTLVVMMTTDPTLVVTVICYPTLIATAPTTPAPTFVVTVTASYSVNRIHTNLLLRMNCVDAASGRRKREEVEEWVRPQSRMNLGQG